MDDGRTHQGVDHFLGSGLAAGCGLLWALKLGDNFLAIASSACAILESRAKSLATLAFVIATRFYRIIVNFDGAARLSISPLRPRTSWLDLLRHERYRRRVPWQVPWSGSRHCQMKRCGPFGVPYQRAIAPPTPALRFDEQVPSLIEQSRRAQERSNDNESVSLLGGRSITSVLKRTSGSLELLVVRSWYRSNDPAKSNGLRRTTQPTANS